MLPLPPRHLRLQKSDYNDARFLKVAAWEAELVSAMESDRHLDVGCGNGRLAIGMSARDWQGTYLGLDCNRRLVDWCCTALTAADPRFAFTHLDVRTSRYNARGALAQHAARFPIAAETFTSASLFSVFTHMWETGISQYLAELHRVLQPGGRCLATWFLYDDREAADVQRLGAYPMKCQQNDHCRYHTPRMPTLAIAYRTDFVLDQVQSAGFEIESIHRGRWFRGGDSDFQDRLILRKGMSP